ncbi:MAG: DUF429 domain-containing protein [Myxococcota bacterium]
MQGTIRGIDGVKGGWIFATGSVFGDKISNIRLSFHSSLNEVELTEIDLIGIDMPIGLPVQTNKGGRTAERMARKHLPGRASSIFSTPCRSCLSAKSYQDALAISRASGPDKLGLSKQSYNILPKIKSLDDLLQKNHHLRSKIYECHPELAFTVMSPSMAFETKHSTNGRAQRIKSLESLQVIPEQWLKRYPIIDQLDALACLWSAHRILSGTAMMVPNPPPSDETGLRMAISW